MDVYCNYLRSESGHQTTDKRPTAVHEISSSTDRRKKRRSKAEKLNAAKAQNSYKKACERPPAIVERRNARERTRVKNVNNIFHRLRSKIPSLKHRTKRVSKLKILKGAIEYMYELQDSLDREDSVDLTIPKSPMSNKQEEEATISTSPHLAAEQNKLRYFPLNPNIITSSPTPNPHAFGREWVYGCTCCTDWLIGTHNPTMFESITAAMAIPAPGTEYITPIPITAQQNQYFLGTITGGMTVGRPSSVPPAYNYHHV